MSKRVYFRDLDGNPIGLGMPVEVIEDDGKYVDVITDEDNNQHEVSPHFTTEGEALDFIEDGGIGTVVIDDF